MKTRERIVLIEEAINKIEEAEEILRDALADTRNKSHYDAYGKYGISQLLGNGNRFDSSLYSLKEEFEEEIQSECAICGQEVTEEETEVCKTCIQ